MQRLLLLFFIMLLSACQTKPRIKRLPPLPIASIVAEPPWLSTPPKDNRQFLYGVGSGDSLKTAKQDALVDLASKLGVDVSAETYNKVSVKQREYEQVERNSFRTVSSKVLDLVINQYQLQASYHPTLYQFHVLVKTDRNSLLSAYQKDLARAIEHYRLEQSLQVNAGLYQQYQRACTNLSLYQALQRKASVVKTLDAQVDLGDFYRYSKRVQQYYLQAKKNLKFRVLAKNKVSKVFSQPLTAVLNQAHLGGVMKTPLAIKVGSSVQWSQSNGFYIGRYLIQLQAYEGRKLLGETQLTVKGVSSRNKQEAQVRAVKKFSHMLSLEQLQEWLGLSLAECAVK